MADLVTRDNVLVVQGDDRPLVWTLSDSTGGPVDLAGYSAKAQVRERVDSTSVLHEWSTEDGSAVLDGSSVSLMVADSEDWTWTRGVYDVCVTDAGGATEVIVRGTIAVTPRVTR